MCHERAATIHLTDIVGDGLKRTNLCDKCFETSKPNDARGLATALQAGCRYCGGEPAGGGPDPIARMCGIYKVSFMCKACAKEFSRFLSQKLPGWGEETITPEQAVKIHPFDIPAIFIEADEHMKKLAAEKNSK